MPAHAGHILMPMDPLARIGGALLEREQLKRVYKQAWREPDQLPGRALTIENVPFTVNGKTQSWSPIQVAVMVARKPHIVDGYDVLRMHTPAYAGEKGDRALEWIDFSVRALKDFLAANPNDFPLTEQYKHMPVEAEAQKELKVITEFDSWDKMPNRWKLTENGLFVPGS